MDWDAAILLGIFSATFVVFFFVLPIIAAMEDEDKNGRD